MATETVTKSESETQSVKVANTYLEPLTFADIAEYSYQKAHFVDGDLAVLEDWTHHDRFNARLVRIDDPEEERDPEEYLEEFVPEEDVHPSTILGHDFSVAGGSLDHPIAIWICPLEDAEEIAQDDPDSMFFAKIPRRPLRFLGSDSGSAILIPVENGWLVLNELP